MNFLDLPSHVRRRIYNAAGLVSSAEIDVLSRRISFNRIDQFTATQVWQDTTFADLKCALGLFFVSHAVHSETQHLFFGSNRFFFRSTEDDEACSLRSLRALHSVAKAAHGHLRAVVLDLNRSWSPCNCLNHTRCEGDALSLGLCKPPLKSSLSQDAGFLEQWAGAASEVGRLVLPHVLELSITCDTADKATARAAAAGLAHFPPLSQCHLRLCQRRDVAIQQIADDAVLRATGRAATVFKVASTIFCFMDLPIEIRHRILSYTDLVTPLQEVQWNPVEKYHLKFRHLLCCKSVKEFWGCWASCPSMGNWIPSDTPGWHYPVVKSTHRDKGLFHHGCTFRNCWQQVDLGGCFCQRYHAATSSSTRNQCRCWVPPRALFLAGRQLYHDAQAVFFAQNRIIVRSHDGPGSTQLTDIQRLAVLGRYPASAFLRGGIAPSSLRRLRFLDVVFPPVDHETSMSTPALTDWLETLDWARDKLDRPRLTIRLEITGYADERSVPPSLQTLDPKQARQIINGYSNIVRGLMALRWASGPGLEEAGLRRIFVHLANPFDGPGNSAPSGSRRGGREWWERSQPEKNFECSIMGYDYNSQVQGKDEFKIAEWKWKQILRSIY